MEWRGQCEAIAGNDATLLGLNMGWIKLGVAGAKQLGAALRRNTHLRHLTLRWNHMGPEEAVLFLEGLAENRSLTTLDFDENPIGPEGMKCLAKALEGNQTLTDLHVTRTDLGEEGAKYLSEMLKTNKTLKLLAVSVNRFGPNGMMILAEGLALNQTLRYLDLSSNSIREEGLLHLVDALGCNCGLKELILSKNDFGAGDKMVPLMEFLVSNTCLEALDLAYNELDAATQMHLANVLSKNKTLKKLNLSWTGMGPTEFERMIDVLKCNTTLQKLQLSGNKISGANTAALISELILVNQMLRELNLLMCHISFKPKGELMIQEALKENASLTMLQLDMPIQSSLLARNQNLAKLVRTNALMLIGIRTGRDSSCEGMGDFGQLPKDVVCMIAKMVWATRGFREWLKLAPPST